MTVVPQSILHVMVLLSGSYGFEHGLEIPSPSPPVIYVRDEVILTKTDQQSEDLIITCMGQQPLKWHTPKCHPPCCHEMVDNNDVDISNSINETSFSSTLKVHNHKGSYTGLYSCMYKDPSDNSNEIKTSTYVYFHRLDNSVELVNDENDVIDTTIGSTLILDCRATHPNDTVSLEFNYEKVDFSSDERIKFDPQKGFIINNVTKGDDGDYRCSPNKRIIVNVKDEIPVLPTGIAEIENPANPANHPFVVGEDITLICKPSVLNFPYALHAHWITPRRSKRYRTSSSNKDRSVLIIEKATKEDSGNYSCSISMSCKMNAQSETTTISIQIKNEEAVVFVDKNIGWKQIVEVKQSHKYWINCPVVGHPKPDIFWYKDNVLINNTYLQKVGHPNLKNPHQLKLVNISKINEGTYKCVANNTKNEIHRSVTLKYVVDSLFIWIIGLAVILVIIILLLIGILAKIPLKRLFCGQSPVSKVTTPSHSNSMDDPEQLHAPANGDAEKTSEEMPLVQVDGETDACDPITYSPSSTPPEVNSQAFPPTFKDTINTAKYRHAVVVSGQKLLHLIMRTLICGDINNVNGCVRETLGSNTQYKNSFTKDEQQILENRDHEKWDLSLLFKVIQKVCGLAPAGDNSWTRHTGGDEPLEYLINTFKKLRNELVHNFELILNEDQLADRLKELTDLALKMTSTLVEYVQKQGKQLPVKEPDETIKVVHRIIEDAKETINESTPAATAAVHESVVIQRAHATPDAVHESDEIEDDEDEEDDFVSDSIQFDNVYVAAGAREQTPQELLLVVLDVLNREFWEYAGPKDV